MRHIDKARARLGAIAASNRLRSVVDVDGGGPEGVLDDGRRVVSFASNDYLGLSQHRLVREAAKAAIDRWGVGSGSARLIVGSRPVHRELEEAIADWKKTEDALLFPSGYAANIGVLSVTGTEGAVIFSDKLNHASIVDGCRLARAETRIYPHRDTEFLRREVDPTRDTVVVTDSVFSMDGDLAPARDLVDLCRINDALLVTDEAHDVFEDAPDEGSRVRVGTLSKFLGSAGGFVAGSAPLIELLRNDARSFIFTTAAPPAEAAAALAALSIFRSDEGTALRARLRALIERVAPGHPTPIVPFVLGDEARALEASRRLRDAGLLVPAIRPPSVAPGASRLRVTLSALHTDEHVDRLLEALEGAGALAHA